ncbi:hypothetical protein FPSE_06394 [Fusarium pseudograminearum CS3096]|uniref:Uncharacterized protein n=1 Tax=Fusarium pseudograminearum (strain CS3096) TaxID=1028729 RepID=K3UML4_FUSPC|nr:hypothetical protein FPSE_06394 [Fusarium pseudograminearum CS3096]EKJ73401.1 hypothetical protein FPSE_06394 [Fusarium pseudograminearum CS3096]
MFCFEHSVFITSPINYFYKLIIFK